MRTILVVLAVGLLLAADKPKEGDKKGTPLPDNRTIDTFTYSYSPSVLGSSAVLSIGKDGTVSYSYQSEPGTNSGGHVVGTKWKIPEKEAKALLDGLVADGVLDLDDTLGGKYPNHTVQATFGRWQMMIHPKKLPEGVGKRLLPLLRKAHPEEYKPSPFEGGGDEEKEKR
jgi:hypothetical protein